MFSKKFILLSMIALVAIGIAACAGVQPQTVTVVETVVVEQQAASADAGRIQLDTVIQTEPPALDPALGTDTTSIFFIKQLFVGLATFDEKANVIPALATDWDVSDDGLTWTFNLRDDIHWVHRDPNTGEFEDVGPVTAQDVVYGVTRTLDPNTASDYAYVLYPIAGAEAFNSADPAAADFEELQAALGVSAPDETTVEFTLHTPAAYFPSIAALWVAFPQPQAAIEQWGNNWTEAGLIVTSGPYTLREWSHGSNIMIEKNPLWVEADDVQIELFGGPIIQEASTAQALYENNEIDIMSDPGWPVPIADIDRIKADPQLSKELLIAPRLCTYYYGFVNSKPPFDDVRVRKAFAAAIDRQLLIDNVTKGNQLPAHSFAPPGIFGNVADDMSIGSYLVEGSYGDRLSEAQSLLAEAGYPDGEGLEVLLMHNTSEDHAQIAQAVQAMWQEAFPKAQVTIENQEWAVYLKTLLPDAPDAEKPNVYRLGWCADYPDSNNWLNEVFNSKSGQNYAKFNNPEFDELVEAAAFESDPAQRRELYQQAEHIFIDEEAAIAPIYYYTYVRLYKPWVKPVISPVSGDPIAQWRIDWEAKLAAQGK